MSLAILFRAQAGESIDSLRKEVDELRRHANARESAPIVHVVDTALDLKYGPNSAVATHSGRLTISGLLQIWYYSIQNDNRGLFDRAGTAPLSDTNEAQDNDSFRVRRAEIVFSMAIHENVTAVILVHPTSENGSFPLIIDNQGSRKRSNNVAPEFNSANGPGLGSTASISSVQNGNGTVPRILEDVFINVHGVIPHHDFMIGQFKPQVGEEGIRSSGQLDFVERSFAGVQNNVWDLGLNIHGAWWEDRFQYSVGILDGAGSYNGSAGANHNRGDDNDEKDFSGRVLVRPLWKRETWGSLEVGLSSKFGTHGESSGSDPVSNPVNGLNRNQSRAILHDGWISYSPGGPVRGLWLRGEYVWIKDRNAPATVSDDGGAGATASGLAQTNGKPFSVEGWYSAIGYKLSSSVFADCSKKWITPFEFAFRYQQFSNVEIADLNKPNHTDVYNTRVFTAGINYYIHGNNAKIQLNYNSIGNPDGGNHNFHNVQNDSFVVNFQVGF